MYHYHEHLSSIVQYLHEVDLKYSDVGEVAKLEQEKEEMEQNEKIKLNMEENKKVALQR